MSWQRTTIRRLSIAAGILVVIIAGASAAQEIRLRAPNAVENPDSSHTHADFALWINGKKMDLSAEKYMEKRGKEGEGKYVHFHDGSDTVIHRHQSGETFGTFLRSLKFSLTSECLTLDTGQQYCSSPGKRWRMFINGSEWPFDPSFVFQDLDRILLTYGADDIEAQRELRLLSEDACRYSRTCPGRGEPPTERCIADPSVPCVE